MRSWSSRINSSWVRPTGTPCNPALMLLTVKLKYSCRATRCAGPSARPRALGRRAPSAASVASNGHRLLILIVISITIYQDFHSATFRGSVLVTPGGWPRRPPYARATAGPPALAGAPRVPGRRRRFAPTPPGRGSPSSARVWMRPHVGQPRASQRAHAGACRRARRSGTEAPDHHALVGRPASTQYPNEEAGPDSPPRRTEPP